MDSDDLSTTLARAAQVLEVAYERVRLSNESLSGDWEHHAMCQEGLTNCRETLQRIGNARITAR